VTIEPARARTRSWVRALRVGGRDRVEANARLTATTAVVLLILFAAELATVLLGARTVLAAHVVVGLILVPPVLLKIASTSWRMLAYYRGDAAYREKGPPALALRILGPFFVFLTVLVFGSGAGLVLIPHDLHSSFLIVHKASFYLWLATLLIHVAAHVKGMVRGAAADALRHTRIEAGARMRQLAVAGSVLLGGALALALAQVAETYLRLYPHK
jgi:hypothetical protein